MSVPMSHSLPSFMNVRSLKPAASTVVRVMVSLVTTTKTDTFSFAGLELRCVTIDGEPRFVAADVCRLLGLSLNAGATRHLSNLKSSEVRTHRFPGTAGKPNAVISESGLYTLVMRAQKANPKAREVQEWVTGTVLPTIRKTGGYIQGEEKLATGEMTDEQFFELAVLKGAETLATCSPTAASGSSTLIRS